MRAQRLEGVGRGGRQRTIVPGGAPLPAADLVKRRVGRRRRTSCGSPISPLCAPGRAGLPRGGARRLLAPDRWLADFEKITIKDEVRPLILKENAMRLFGLSQGSPWK